MSESTSWPDDEVKRSWQPRSENLGCWSTSSWFDESHKGVDEEEGCSVFAFLGKAYEISSGFPMNDWSSPLLDDGLTYDVSCAISTMGATVDEDTHAKSWMVGSPTMLGKNGGGSDGRESFFVECWCSNFHSYSSWMIAHVGCATPTLSMGCSSFTTSEESGMDEHKTTSSRGTPRCEDGGLRKGCIWELEGLTTKSTRKLSGVMLGECEGWAWSPTSLGNGGAVEWEEGG